jgi:hypothetical protein
LHDGFCTATGVTMAKAHDQAVETAKLPLDRAVISSVL